MLVTPIYPNVESSLFKEDIELDLELDKGVPIGEQAALIVLLFNPLLLSSISSKYSCCGIMRCLKMMSAYHSFILAMNLDISSPLLLAIKLFRFRSFFLRMFFASFHGKPVRSPMFCSRNLLSYITGVSGCFFLISSVVWTHVFKSLE